MSKGHFTSGKLVAIDSNTYAISIRLGFQVALKLNQKHFIIRIVHNLENPNTS
ncbi:hypothetical protein RhiirC2_794416, partial [Rhizophagus irregularis]